MIKFSDIFKSSFLENVTGVSVTDMVLTFVLAFLIGLFIAFVYKKTYTSVMYSSNFAGTLVAMSVITSMAILAVTSNVVLSLGMVGALSIVRFRAAIKEPMEIAYLFWSIVVGIVLAAGLIPMAIVGSGITGIIMLLFMQRKALNDPYIAVISCDSRDAESRAGEFLKKYVKKSVLKSTTARKGCIELNYEVLLRSDDTSFVSEMAELEGVNSVVLVSYNGDYLG